MGPSTESLTAALRENGTVRAVLSSLLWRKGGMPETEVVVELRRPVKEIGEAIASLRAAGYLIVSPLSEQGLLRVNPELQSEILAALERYEQEHIARRAAQLSLHAADKIRAIDTLAEGIFIARNDFRKNADLLRTTKTR